MLALSISVCFLGKLLNFPKKFAFFRCAYHFLLLHPYFQENESIFLKIRRYVERIFQTIFSRLSINGYRPCPCRDFSLRMAFPIRSRLAHPPLHQTYE